MPKDYIKIAAGLGAASAAAVAAFFDVGFVAAAACTIISGGVSAMAAEPVKKLIESCSRVDTKKDDDAATRRPESGARPAPILTQGIRVATPTLASPSASTPSPIGFHRRTDWGQFAEEKRKQRQNSPQTPSPHSL